MKTFNKTAAQGDLLLRRVDSLPEGLEEAKPDKSGRHIVAHSETGHHHYLKHDGVAYFRDPKDPMVAYLRIGTEGADLVHDRPFDTHETIHVSEGVYQVRRQREHTPDGWRRIED